MLKAQHQAGDLASTALLFTWTSDSTETKRKRSTKGDVQSKHPLPSPSCLRHDALGQPELLQSAINDASVPVTPLSRRLS